MLFVFFLFNLFGLIFLAKKFGYISSNFLVYFVFFIYGNSFTIDFILFGLNQININGLGKLMIYDSSHVYISFFYSLFSLGFIIISNFNKNQNVKLKSIYFFKKRKTTLSLLYLFFSSINFYLIANLYTLDRLEKIYFLTNNKLLTSLASLGMFGFIIVIMRRKIFPTKSILGAIYLFSIVLFGLFEGGRELFVYLILLFLFYKRENKLKFMRLFLILFSVYFLSLWKYFSVYILLLGDTDLFFSSIKNSMVFSITYIDPHSSLLMLSKFINNDAMFSEFHFSYFTNTLNQFLSAIGLIEYNSIGKQIVFKFSPDIFYKGGGFAFSGILESILNFGFAGPLLLGMFLSYLCNLIHTFKRRDEFRFKLFSIFLIILSMKIVRTELAVVIKLYLLPMLVSYLIFFKYFITRKQI